LHYPTEANISDLVLKKMGITPKPATAAAAPTTAPAPAAAPKKK
jgi:outer membrane protein